MSTIKTTKCDFCGLMEDAVSIKSITFLEDDVHICDRCTPVIANLLFEASQISMSDPQATVYAGQKGLNKLILELHKNVLPVEN